jgi:hypothetical protein
MKRSARVNALTHAVIAAVVCALFAACASQFDPPRPDVLAMPSSREVFDAAQQYYRVGSERPPRDTVDQNFPRGHSVPDSDAPTMTIATLTAGPVPGPLPGKLLARITSNRDYAPMGIEQGPNILWRDSLGRVWITPRSGSSRQLYQVPRYVFRLLPGHEPSLIRVHTNSFSFVACVDDCSSGHCGMF